MRKRARFILLVIAATCFCVDGFGHSPMDKAEGCDLQQLVDQSNLVFTGRATNVTYRTIKGGEGEGEIPYTFVTYRVEKVLRGKAPGDQITLRFVGGPDGRGRFLSVTGVPVVQEGDHDVLFVGNTEDPSCPLVFCEHGRYRILNEQMYDTYGAPVREILKDKVLSRGPAPAELLAVRYPTPKFDDLMKNPEVQELLKRQNLSADEARRRYESEAPKFLEFRESYETPEKNEDAGDQATAVMQIHQPVPLPLGRFISATEELVKRSKRTPVAIRGVSVGTAFRAARLTLTKPTAITPGKFTPATAEADEYKAYEQNGSNPVIRKNQ